MTFEMGILYGVLILTLLSAWRVILGPTVWDRLLGLNLVSSKLVMMIVLLACIREAAFLLDVALVYGLLGFVGVTFMAKMLLNKHRT